MMAADGKENNTLPDSLYCCCVPLIFGDLENIFISGNSTESLLSVLQVHSRPVAMSPSQRMDICLLIALYRVPLTPPMIEAKHALVRENIFNIRYCCKFKTAIQICAAMD